MKFGTSDPFMSQTPPMPARRKDSRSRVRPSRGESPGFIDGDPGVGPEFGAEVVVLHLWIDDQPGVAGLSDLPERFPDLVVIAA